MMTKAEFYGILKTAVLQSNPVGNFPELKTFAVLRSIGDLNAENLNKTIVSNDTEFYYSRGWDETGRDLKNVKLDFPGLFVLDESPELRNALDSRAEICSELALYFLSPNPEKFIVSSNQYEVLSIYEFLNVHAARVFDYLSNVVFATTNLDLGGSWYRLEHLADMLSDGDITSYSVNDTKSDFYIKKFRANNPTVSAAYIDDETKHNLCGVRYSVIFCECFNYTGSEFDYDKTLCC